MVSNLDQLLHNVLLVGVLFWGGYAVVKLAGPLLLGESADDDAPSGRRALLVGAVVLAVLFLLDQSIHGRFR